MDHEYGRPWIKIDEQVTPFLAEIVGELHVPGARDLLRHGLTAFSPQERKRPK